MVTRSRSERWSGGREGARGRALVVGVGGKDELRWIGEGESGGPSLRLDFLERLEKS